MATKFYFIDDDPNSQNKVRGFENNDLTIDAMQHKDSWGEEISFLNDQKDQFDGIILDLKLDDLPNRNGKRADFRGTSLAQEIRTRQKEGDMNSFPIILFSANDKIQQALENSGKDLFDIRINKSKLNESAFSYFTPQLIDLSDGYKRLSGSSLAISQVLQIDEMTLDSRFVGEYNKNKECPVHIQSRFLITEFLTKQGLVIDENVLAARLGIDKSNSDNWSDLLKNLSKAKYQGVFSKGWSRWWMHLVEQWWNETIKAETFLRSTPAAERVEKIKEVTKLPKLVAAKKTEKSESDEFWTVCKGLGQPLDPVDGLLIQGQDNLYSWQEPEYVSVDAALLRKNIEKWIGIADIEKERYENLKVWYSRKKQ